jgi:hypothetical protein
MDYLLPRGILGEIKRSCSELLTEKPVCLTCRIFLKLYIYNVVLIYIYYLLLTLLILYSVKYPFITRE